MACYFITIVNIYLDIKGDKIHNIKNNSEFSESVIIQETNIKNLPNIFWVCTLFTMFCYGAYMPFNYIASGFLIENSFKDLPKEIAVQKAGLYMSIPFMISSVFVAFFGFLLDKVGKRANLAVVSSVLGILGFTSFYFFEPLWGFVLIGFSYSLAATIVWNIMSIILKGNMLVNLKINLKFEIFLFKISCFNI